MKTMCSRILRACFVCGIGYATQQMTLGADRATNFVVTLTNVAGRIVERVVLPSHDTSDVPYDFDLGYASPEATTVTNVHGYLVTLFAATNQYTEGKLIEVSLAIVNATLARPNISYSRMPESVPGFGRIQIQRMADGQSMTYCGERSRSTRDLGGELNPGNSLKFTFNLTTHYCVKDPGSYEVRFQGALPSLTEDGKEVLIETSPLTLTIHGAKTNVSPNISSPLTNQSASEH